MNLIHNMSIGTFLGGSALLVATVLVVININNSQAKVNKQIILNQVRLNESIMQQTQVNLDRDRQNVEREQTRIANEKKQLDIQLQKVKEALQQAQIELDKTRQQAQIELHNAKIQAKEALRNAEQELDNKRKEVEAERKQGQEQLKNERNQLKIDAQKRADVRDEIDFVKSQIRDLLAESRKRTIDYDNCDDFNKRQRIEKQIANIKSEIDKLNSYLVALQQY